MPFTAAPGPNTGDGPDPASPIPSPRPFERTAHGEVRADPFAWLANRDDPAVLEYLKAENAYAESLMGMRSEATETLYEEIRSHINEDDVSVPVRHRNYEYWTATTAGAQYPLHLRRRLASKAAATPGAGADTEGDAQVLFDTNAAASKHEYYDLGILSVSPNQELLAWGSDTEGDERYHLTIRELATGIDSETVADGIGYGVAWSTDSSVVFYVRLDHAHRPHEVWRHRLGTSPHEDQCIFEERDDRFSVDIGTTKSDDYIVIVSTSSTTTELHTIDARSPLESPRCFAPRVTGVEYEIDHDRGDSARAPQWIVLHNIDAPDGSIATCPIENTEPANWREFIAHEPGTRLLGTEMFSNHVAIAERHEVATRIRVVDLRDHSERTIAPTGAGMIELLGSAELEDALRYIRTSLIEPRITIDLDLVTGEERVRKEQLVPGGFDQNRYACERIWATAPDGTRVPLTVAHRRDIPLDGTAPCLLYGYGSYELCVDPTFSALRLPLLDRGVVYAIAHIRGGGEMGRPWYEDGKLGNKHHTFSDFVAAADHLVSNGYTTNTRLAIRGRSAGGLLIGATLNLRPDLCAIASLEVPFVDALTTMLDESIPLTTLEYEEWGNPNEPNAYTWMRSYSPLDNLRESETYPALYVCGGLNDPRVGYWEPAKYVATIRHRIDTRGPVILRTELGAGHGGPSGRYHAWKEEALVLRHLMDGIGVAE